MRLAGRQRRLWPVVRPGPVGRLPRRPLSEPDGQIGRRAGKVCRAAGVFGIGCDAPLCHGGGTARGSLIFLIEGKKV